MLQLSMPPPVEEWPEGRTFERQKTDFTKNCIKGSGSRGNVKDTFPLQLKVSPAHPSRFLGFLGSFDNLFNLRFGQSLDQTQILLQQK